MKTRNGFVSNSSSSSFLIILPRKPQNEKQMFKYMFNNQNKILSIYDIEAGSEEVSKLVYKDICDKRKSTKKEIKEFFSHQIQYDIYELKDAIRRNDIYEIIDFIHRESKSPYAVFDYSIIDDLKVLIKSEEEYYSDPSKSYPTDATKIVDKLVDELADAAADRFINDHGNYWYGIVEYADEDGGINSLMEHGDIFRHIEHIKVSNH